MKTIVYYATYLQPSRPDAVFKGYRNKQIIEIITEKHSIKQTGYIEDSWRLVSISKSTFYKWKKRWQKNN